MAKRLRLILSDEARDAIKQILLYTETTWGPRQATAYERLIDDGLEHLTLFPKIGHRREDLPPGYRRYFVGQHAIYYLVEGDTVSVTRILHVSLDPEDEFS